MLPNTRRPLTLALAVAWLATSTASDAQLPQPAPHGAEQQARRDSAAGRHAAIDALLARLKDAASEAAAKPIIAAIQEQWMRSGDEAVDDLVLEAVIYTGRGLFKPALDTLAEAVRRAPEFAEAWHKRATVHYLMEQPALALADYDQALLVEPRHFGALAGRGLVLMQQRDWKGALASFRAAQRLNPFLRERATLIPELEKRAGERGI